MILVPIHIFFIQLSFSWTVLNIFLTFHRHCTAGFFTSSLTTSAVSTWTFQSASLSWFVFQVFLSVSFVSFCIFSHSIYFFIMSDCLVFGFPYPHFSSHNRISVALYERVILIFHGSAFIFSLVMVVSIYFIEGEFM